MWTASPARKEITRAPPSLCPTCRTTARPAAAQPPTKGPPAVTVPLSILDLATIGKGQTAAESFAGSVAMAQLAEKLGYRRVWYAEHHNMSSIASSATSVLIAHVAAHTERIRLGAGGVMLPNHSPLTIAEQFGTLETLHPGRIDLGLGRAPGSDQNTMRALRRDPHSGRHLPAGRPGTAGLPHRAHPRAGGGGYAGQGNQRAPLHSGLLPLRCAAGGPAGAAVRLRLPTSPRTRCRTPSPCTAGSSSRQSSWPRRTS
jgi:hypothetical protein